MILHGEYVKTNAKDEKLHAASLVWSDSAYRSWQEHAERLNHALAVQEVIRRYQQVPAEGAEPGQVMWLVHSVANSDDFVEAFDLNQKHLNQYKTYI